MTFFVARFDIAQAAVVVDGECSSRGLLRASAAVGPGAAGTAAYSARAGG